jgi:hypothetical protein
MLTATILKISMTTPELWRPDWRVCEPIPCLDAVLAYHAELHLPTKELAQPPERVGGSTDSRNPPFVA